MPKTPKNFTKHYIKQINGSKFYLNQTIYSHTRDPGLNREVRRMPQRSHRSRSIETEHVIRQVAPRERFFALRALPQEINAVLPSRMVIAQEQIPGGAIRTRNYRDLPIAPRVTAVFIVI